jgi:4-hydroxy-tetrahydrodipicolinate reductase
MPEKIRVIQYGLGPIGSAVARHITERAGLELVGAVDVDPAKAGRDAGEVIGLGRSLGFAVTSTLAQTLARTKADIVTHCTSSYVDRFQPQIIEILGAGLDIVSTAEELSFPWLDHADAGAAIDAAARKAGKTVLATGVNPGFLMDSLPLNLTAICQRVDHIALARLQNASLRRGPFQAKIGSGLTVAEFEVKMAGGRMGHVGLPESTAMIFDTLGKKLVHYETTVEPVVADRRITTPFFDVQPGFVCGVKQVARAYAPEGEFLTLTFVAALDNGVEQDTVSISGVPNLEVTLKGTNGDLATVAIAVNAIKRVHNAAPGLVTMRDLPIVTSW